MSKHPLAGRDRRAAARPPASRRGRAAPRDGRRSAGRPLQLPPARPRVEGAAPLAALPARPVRAQRLDVALGVPARDDRSEHRVGGAVRVLRVPDVAAGPDRVLRGRDAARSRASAALEINPSVAFTMVDRMLGGTGQTPAPNRALTEIEQNVIDSVVKLLLEHLTETWRAVADVQFRIQGRETRPQMLQVTGPNEIVVLLALRASASPRRAGMVNLCIPGGGHRGDGGEVRAGLAAHAAPAERRWSRLACSANLGRVPLPVTALLETTSGRARAAGAASQAMSSASATRWRTPWTYASARCAAFLDVSR